MNKKNILFIARSVTLGGEGIYIQETSNLLSDYFNVSTISLVNDKKLSNPNFLFTSWSLNNKPVIKPFSFFVFLKLLKQNDIAQHFFFGIYSIFFFIFSLFFQKNNIVTFHTNLYSNKNLVWRYYSYLVKFISINLVVFFGKKIIFLTEFQSNDFKRFCFLKKRFNEKKIIIFNYIDDSFFNSEKKNFLPTLKVLFVGRFTKEKGFFDYLQLRKEYLGNNELSFFAIGDTGDGFISDGVKILSKVQHHEMVDVYKKHDILVMCSHNETFSLAVVEAMASGLVVISTNLGPVLEYFTEKNGFIVNVGDIFAMKKALDLCLKEPTLMKEIAEYNTWYSSNFKKEKRGIFLKKIYLDVI